MKKLSLLGQPLQISEEREAYNRYRLLFLAEADRAQARFSQVYENYHSIDDVVQRASRQAMECIDPVIQKCVQILLEHNVLSVDEASFKERYSGYCTVWEEAFLTVYDRYAEIVMDQQQLDEYRVARRQSRARWQGGGFGVSGALKGAATAGALNIISGAGHMVFNGIGKIISSISASIQKDKIFNDPKTYETLSQGVWNAAFILHFALIDSLNATGVDTQSFAGVVSDDDAATAAAMLNNAKITTSEDQRRTAITQSFLLNPYQEEWYRYVLDAYGDPDGSLSRLEKHFGLTVIQQEKERQLEEFAQSLPLDTEEEALLAVERIQQKKKALNYRGETEGTKMALDAVERFDECYRTVDDVLLETREAADLAREELSAIIKLENKVDYQSLRSIANVEKAVSVYTSQVAQKHQQALHEAWSALDHKQRSVDTLLENGKPILCRTAKKAEELRPIVQQLHQKLLSCGDGPEAEAALSAFKENLGGEDLPSALKNQYIEETDRRLAEIDRALRTTLGKEYSTRDEARAADAQYQAIREAFVSGDPRKNGDQMRKNIEAANFSENVTSELLTELFRCENAKELKTAKRLNTVSTIILLVIVLGSFLFHLSGTAEFAQKNIIVKGVSLMVTDVEVTEHMGFLDGLKNGLVVFGRSAGMIFTDGFFSYIGGFDHGLIGNILWAIFGLFWVFIKQFLLFFVRYIVSLFVTFFQSASILYYPGYIIGAAIPLITSQFCFDEEDEEENVQKIKGWKRKSKK